jgi:hypothetical protein
MMINIKPISEDIFKEQKLAKKGEGKWEYNYDKLPISLKIINLASTETMLENFFDYLNTLKSMEDFDKRLLKHQRIPITLFDNEQKSLEECKHEVLRKLEQVRYQNEKAKKYLEEQRAIKKQEEINLLADKFLEDLRNLVLPYHKIWEGSCQRCHKTMALHFYTDVEESHWKTLHLGVFGCSAEDTETGIHYCPSCEIDRERQRKIYKTFDSFMLKPFLEQLTKGCYQFNYLEFCRQFSLDRSWIPKPQTVCKNLAKDLNRDDIQFNIDGEEFNAETEGNWWARIPENIKILIP